jgi:hypothetical protein
MYWTASDNDSATAPFYNFGKDGGAVHRQPQGASWNLLREWLRRVDGLRPAASV